MFVLQVESYNNGAHKRIMMGVCKLSTNVVRALPYNIHTQYLCVKVEPSPTYNCQSHIRVYTCKRTDCLMAAITYTYIHVYKIDVDAHMYNIHS